MLSWNFFSIVSLLVPVTRDLSSDFVILSKRIRYQFTHNLVNTSGKFLLGKISWILLWRHFKNTVLFSKIPEFFKNINKTVIIFNRHQETREHVAFLSNRMIKLIFFDLNYFCILLVQFKMNFLRNILSASFQRAFCAYCRDRIWGLGRQGLRCIHCKLLIHKKCHKWIEKPCSNEPVELFPREDPANGVPSTASEYNFLFC